MAENETESIPAEGASKENGDVAVPEDPISEEESAARENEPSEVVEDQQHTKEFQPTATDTTPTNLCTTAPDSDEHEPTTTTASEKENEIVTSIDDNEKSSESTSKTETDEKNADSIDNNMDPEILDKPEESIIKAEEEEEEEDEETIADFDPEFPPPFPPKVSSDRRHAHQRLRCYESRRRKAYGAKLSSSSLYWRSFREIISASVEEVIRAERIVRAHVVAAENYAIHMKAIHDDTLDNEFKPAYDVKKKKNLLAFLKKGAAFEKKDGNINANPVNGGNSKGTFKLGDMTTVDKSEGLGKNGPFLNSIIESQIVLAERYGECAATWRELVAIELTNLREQLENQVSSMEDLGNAILAELKAAEGEVAQTWEIYYDEAQKTMSNGGSSTAQSVKEKRRGAILSETEETDDLIPLKECTDLWICEMHYRMSVAFLSACWDKCSQELSRLFASMKDTECSRRHRLRELLVTFMQKEERLWASLPSIITPVLNEMVSRPLETAVIEEDVQTAIRIRAQGIQREEASEVKNTPDGPGLSPELVKNGNFELSSPLVSEQLCMAKVMETKNIGMMRSWKTVLAVITGDSFLHLFEIPSSLRVQSGSAPEVAFHALVPPVEIPTDKNAMAIESASYAPRMWNENLSPYDSIILPNARISFDNDKVNSAFEITETTFNRGANKVFGKLSSRKILFRTRTYQESKEWIAALKALK